MSRFSSPRERWLWCCAAITLLAIYGSLPVASSLAALLYSQELAAIGFLAALLLTAATIVVIGLQTRPHRREIGVAVGLTVVYALVLLRLTLPERSHLIEYSILAALVYEALLERAAQGARVPFPAGLAISITSMAGMVDEIVQAIVPSRHFQWSDIVFNVLAAVMAVSGIAILRWVRRRYGRHEHESGAAHVAPQPPESRQE